MIKYLILLFNMLFLFAIKIFVNEGVTITPSFPSSVKSGSEFVMEFTIKRNNVEGFAKFQQDLPKGFTAKEDESQGASFSSKGQSVKLVWTSLPDENEFKISYKIKVDESAAGDYPLGGKFSYVVDNAKQMVDFPVSITVITSPGDDNKQGEMVNNAQKDNIKDNSTTETESLTAGPSSLSCVRKISPTANPSEFMVEIVVNKGTVGGFAKLQENIPSGYSALAGKVNNASFTFTEQKAKFVWLSIPSDPSFTISYTVKADPEIKGETSIDGIFSYIENDETKKSIVATSQFVNNGPSESSESNLTAATIDTTVKKTADNIQATVDSAKSVAKEEISQVTDVPSPENTVVYKVQLAALHKTVDVSYFKQHNKITERINTEMHEGWTKYTTGSFKEYKPARDHRENIRTKNIKGPFVAAYNTGKRITVQEALMITSQKWYK